MRKQSINIEKYPIEKYPKKHHEFPSSNVTKQLQPFFNSFTEPELDEIYASPDAPSDTLSFHAHAGFFLLSQS